jgi:hypothetical protein
VYEDDSISLWLLGWRPGVDTIDIHGHGASAALVTCLTGEVDETDYGVIPVPAGDKLEGRVAYEGFPTISICRAGGSMYLPVGTVHEMRCNKKEGRGFALTLHAYSPRLSLMTYFTPEKQSNNGAPHRLTYSARWIDTGESVSA